MTDEEVWMRAFCASMTDVGLTVQACVCAADDSLKAFRTRFPKEELNCELGTILNATPDSKRVWVVRSPSALGGAWYVEESNGTDRFGYQLFAGKGDATVCANLCNRAYALGKTDKEGK